MGASHPCLTACPGHGDIESSRYAYRAGPLTLKQRRIKRHPEALFHACRSIMAAGMGILRDGRSLCPVLATHASPPPKPLTEVADSTQAKESIMSHDKTPGASAEITFRYISLDTAIKRTRRHLAKTGATLVKSKPGTKAWAELGDFAIKDASGELLAKSVNLRSFMESQGLLAKEERIELPGFSGWRWYVARRIAVKCEGQTVLCNEPLTRVYFTEKQARRAAESIADKAGLVICSFDASGKSGGRDA